MSEEEGFSLEDVQVEFDTRKKAPGDHWEKRRQAVEWTRKLCEKVVTCQWDTEKQVEVSQALRQVEEALQEMDHRMGRSRKETIGQKRHRERTLELSPFTGHSNPLAPPMNLWSEGVEATARATLGSAYEVIPGIVHPGYVSALFDQLLGYTQAILGDAGLTARLKIEHHEITPSHCELILKARLERRRGKRLYCEGSCTARGRHTASAEGVFVSIPRERYRELEEESDEVTG